MSFQAYLDNIEQKTGLTPRQFVELATAKGFDSSTKATKHVDSGGTHSDPSDTLWLDGKATNPANS